MSVIQCLVCGKDVTVSPSQVGRKKYCSKECMGKHRGYGQAKDKKCLNCKKTFKPVNSRYDRTKYCSRKCLEAHKKHNITEERRCKVCGKVFTSYIEKSKERLCCSGECAKVAISAAGKRRDSRVMIACAICGTGFRVFPCRVGEEKYCSKECGKKASIESLKNRTVAKRQRGSLKTVTIPCGYCGKELTRFRCRVKNGERAFCDRGCYARWDSDHKKTPESIERFSKTLINNRKVSTGIEKSVIEWFNDRGIEYEHQVAIKTYIVDFRANDYLIEVNGCYWHGCPQCFPKTNNIQHSRMCIDKSKRTYCKNKGLKLLEIWEHDIKKGNFDALRPLIK